MYMRWCVRFPVLLSWFMTPWPMFHVSNATLERQDINSVKTQAFFKKRRVSDCVLFHFGVFHLWRCQVSPIQKIEGNSSSRRGHWGCPQYFPSQYKLTKCQLVVAHAWQVKDKSEILRTSLGTPCSCTLGWNKTSCKHCSVAVAYRLWVCKNLKSDRENKMLACKSEAISSLW